jgi:ABC-2 type transport system ATP-binding protein
VSPPAIETRDLVVRLRRRPAINGLDLDCDTGVNGLLGPNGAGKTTLMRVLATVTTPISGSVRLLGQDATSDIKERELRALRRRIGYLPQNAGFYPRFTVREFVEYFAWLKELPSATVPLTVDRALERTDLHGRADDKLKHLSGGMLRRVGIAQAIVNDPAVVLLDEPTAGLDPEQRLQFRELLRELGQDSCVLVGTHLIEDLAACDRVLVIDGGRRVFAGTPGELAATHGGGDGDLERGYTAVLHANRAGAA